MPYGTERAGATYARVILRVVSGSEIAENAVVDGSQVPLNADGRRVLEAGQVLVWAGLPEIQQVAVPAGTPFQLAFGANTTAVIPNAVGAPAPAASVAAALQALASVGAGNVDVAGADGGPYTVTFVGALGAQNVAAMTSPTGGVTITVTREGAPPGPGQKTRPAPVSGIVAADVAGILREPFEFWPDAPGLNKGDEAVAAWTKNCHFASDQLTGYSGNAAAVEAAMSAAGNGRCANCTFEP